MTKHRLISLALALCALLSAAGCAPAPAPEITAAPTQTPTAMPVAAWEQFALPCYPEAGFHPITGGNRTNLQLAPLLYEGLFALDPTFAPQPVLCESWQAAGDGLSWTFLVQAGARFSDGSALTPADVAYSLNLARTSPLYAARLADVTAVTAGERGVTVALAAPNGALPALLDIPVVRENGRVPLGTGPYALSGAARAWSLEAVDGWWQGEALPVQHIALHAVQAADDLLYAFDTREISLVSTDFTGTNALGYAGSYETLDYPTTVMLYVGFNARDGVCADQTVRRALTRDLDRATVAAILLARHAVPAALPFPPGGAYYDRTLAAALEYAPQQAAALLGEAGWTLKAGRLSRGGRQMALKFVVNQDNTYRLNVAEQLATALNNLGIAVTLEKLPWDEYVAALEAGEFDLYLGEVRLTADLDLRPLVRDGGALNYGGFVDRDTAALQAAYQAASGAARVAASKALAADLAEKVPFAPLCFKNGSVLSQWGQVAGLAPTQQNLFYGFADWKINGSMS